MCRETSPSIRVYGHIRSHGSSSPRNRYKCTFCWVTACDRVMRYVIANLRARERASAINRRDLRLAVNRGSLSRRLLSGITRFATLQMEDVIESTDRSAVFHSRAVRKISRDSHESSYAAFIGLAENYH